MSGLNETPAHHSGYRHVSAPRSSVRSASALDHLRYRESAPYPNPGPFDVVCVSHLRWRFVVQRPQHLLRRFARDRRVLFIEEHEFTQLDDHMRIESVDGIILVTPQLKVGEHNSLWENRVRTLLDAMLLDLAVSNFLLWYYTPMALDFTRHLIPRLIVWDCMDELSAFAFAPKALLDRETELLQRAHVVFTGGVSLYEAKRHRHHNIHSFPSSIDTAHFGLARSIRGEPTDQAAIPHPRIGFCGVIDERFDIELLRESARLRPDWQWVMIGPVVKIDPATLPEAPNIHYLGKKDYAQLPDYLAGWDAAILPFARNESTRFISPTKTPEYLAAGCAVVSTSIQDVIRPYGEKGMVRIADHPEEFVTQIEAAIAGKTEHWLRAVDQHLALSSWDQTHQQMLMQIHQAMVANATTSTVTTTPLPV